MKRREQIIGTHRKIRTAFQCLKKHFGFNYNTAECCSSCASHRGLKDYLFLNPQTFPMWEYFADVGAFYIGFCNPSNGSEKALGELAVMALEAQGLNVLWDGDPTKRIVVTA